MRRDVGGIDEVVATIDEERSVRIAFLEGRTDGQAISCLAGLDEAPADQPLTIGACDNGVLYDGTAFEALVQDADTDVILWGFRGHPGAMRTPEAYGWIEADERGAVSAVSVKKPLSDPATDPIVIGVFTFKRAEDFRKAATRMITRDAKVNGEFYVDTCINDALAMGLSVKLLECSGYLCWGTPDEFRQFNYWQKAFHTWPSHPYRIEDDPHVAADAIEEIVEASQIRAMPLPRSDRPC